MAWIKSFQELLSHPKTKRLARMLGVTLPDVVGRLHLLWWWAMNYAKDGNLSKYDASDIADAVEWDGDQGLLLNALIKTGFIDKNKDGTMVLRDWDTIKGDFS